MIDSRNSVVIRRELEDVFRFVATEFFDNYLKWSPEVCQLEKLTAGEMRVGVKARQVRLDAGYRSEALFQVVDFKPDQVLRFTSLSKPRFEVCYRFEHVAADTRLSFDFRADLPLYLLPLSGYIEKIIGQSGRRVVANLKTMLEADAESTMKRKPGS